MATTNNNLQPIRMFTPEFRRIIASVFRSQAAFNNALQPVQVLDGVTHNATAFTVKTNNTPVVFNTYNTAQALGSGNNASRFGAITEIIYADTDVPYDTPRAIHEALDRFTVNEGLEHAVASRLDVQSQASIRHMNKRNGAYISSRATNKVGSFVLNEANLVATFSAMAAYYVNQEVIAPVTAYVTPAIFNALVDAELITTLKNSNVNIDSNTLNMYKGFIIQETPAQYFANTDLIYFVADNTLIPFIGIETARTMETDKFDGVLLQAAFKDGIWTSDDSAMAISKVTIAAV